MKALLLILLLSFLTVYNLYSQNDIYYETPLERGYSRLGQRVGVWEFYNTPNDLVLKVDYENDKLLYIKPDTSQFIIKRGNSWERSKLDVPCQFHGVPNLLREYFENFRLPYEIQKAAPQAFSLMFEVHEDGIARNPEVLNDPGFGVKEILLKAFANAPNAWIAGYKDGRAVKTRFSIDFFACDLIKCDDIKKEGPLARVLFSNFYFKSSIAPNAALNDVQVPFLHWSPEDKKIMLRTTIIGELTDERTVNGTFIVDIKSRKVIQHPYRIPFAHYWLSEDKILFKYKYNNLPEYLAEFDLRSLKTKTIEDSLTYFHTFSKDRSRLAFVSENKNDQNVTIWESDMSTNKVAPIIKTPASKTIIPVSYSPDRKYLLGLEFDRASGTKNNTLIEIESQKKTYIPILHTVYCGWSGDGKFIYLNRQLFGEFEISSTIFWYNTQSGEFGELLKKAKKVSGAVYNQLDDNFLIFRKDGIYLMGNHPDATMKLLQKNVTVASWSNDGRQIAYINDIDRQLYVLNVESKMSTKISNWEVKIK